MTAKYMKTLLAAIASILMVPPSVSAHPQNEHLAEAYKAQGDSFFVPLYWLPETRGIVRKHIPNHQDWVGFEMNLWKELDEGEKLAALEELGAELDHFDEAKLNATWKRIRDWNGISSQLSLLAIFLDSGEGFLDMAYNDPVLRPAFKWVIDRRKADFDTTHIGSTLSSGETALFYPVLIQHLLNTSEKQRLECFSRILAHIAETKAAGPAPSAGKAADKAHAKDQPPLR